MKEKKPITEGEHRVRIDFNPSGDTRVTEIKSLAVELIDLVHFYGKDDRCTALAMTAFEEGVMWAVKSITKPDRK
ncbi:hypothetical protein NX722_05655 [Endozoicomonas gorgoniicola]|uniref:Acb2/Tad1 hairpin domain-containing protein n=1 Tax=Endozoicomonas gorgoniicola TaxID=1234144 RepID=A0ABT3MRY5_9GAMM|nr:hypothetical protein [Endozoicomonas gorgoniicola]MCW7552138.1 hypothetical protein [Endozoicomonas gorgoniicola]